MTPRTSTRSRRVLAALAAVPLFGALLVAPTAASADPLEDCDWQPLKYSKNYTIDGEHVRTKANLRVYDLCDEGAFTGYLYADAYDGSSDSDISPFSPKIDYKRQLDSSFRGSSKFDLDRKDKKDGWRPWKVSSDDIDLEPNGGYFMEVRIRWTFTVDDDKYTKTVYCDRIHDHGSNAFTCHS